MSRAVVTLLQQSQRMLDTLAPRVKEEANKKIGEIKNKIPTKDSVEQMMMDEITSRGPELVCSIEVRNRIDSIYTKLNNTSLRLKSILDKSNEKLLIVQEKILKLQKILNDIELIFLTLKALVPVLQTIIITARVSIYLLKGPAANVDAGLKLKDQIDKSNAKIKEINNSIKVFGVKLTKIRTAITAVSIILTLALVTISTLQSTISSVIGLIESYYLKYTLMCDVEGDSMEDEAFAAAVDEAQSTLDENLGMNTDPNEEGVYILQENLYPKTIERIQNANFQVIQYRIT
tara:strand:+ start:395 stop:1264 length:870 start_codon:yes stop_codon:yes gene_type:complete